MVSKIGLNIPYQNLKLNKRAENVSVRFDTIIRYEIANIYNPKVRFSFRHQQINNGPIHIEIRKLKERI